MRDLTDSETNLLALTHGDPPGHLTNHAIVSKPVHAPAVWWAHIQVLAPKNGLDPEAVLTAHLANAQIVYDAGARMSKADVYAGKADATEIAARKSATVELARQFEVRRVKEAAAAKDALFAEFKQRMTDEATVAATDAHAGAASPSP